MAKANEIKYLTAIKQEKRAKKFCRFKKYGIKYVDYKDAEFLKKRVKDVAAPEELRAEDLTLKKFGLVPQDFDLAKNTVDLLTEQAAAFYDYDKKKLFITETTPSETQEPVLAHELSHALADQSFNLAKFIRQGRKSDDGSAARLAVMEGQATWLMSELLARRAGRSLKDSPDLLANMRSIGALGRAPRVGALVRAVPPLSGAETPINAEYALNGPVTLSAFFVETHWASMRPFSPCVNRSRYPRPSWTPSCVPWLPFDSK